MKISDIDTNTEITDIENMFKISEDEQGRYKFNLNETLYLNVDDDACEEYILKTNAFWPLISYHIYKTTHLAWFLMKLNKVDGFHIFDMRKAGDKIKYLPIDTVEGIVGNL